MPGLRGHVCNCVVWRRVFLSLLKLDQNEIQYKLGARIRSFAHRISFERDMFQNAQAADWSLSDILIPWEYSTVPAGRDYRASHMGTSNPGEVLQRPVLTCSGGISGIVANFSYSCL